MNLKSLDAIKINFIIGTGRSGTALLSVMLNEYPNCISTPEIHHFVYFYKKYKNITKVTPKLKDDIYHYLFLFFNYEKNPLFGPLDKTLIETLIINEPITYGQLIKLIYLGLYGRKGIDNDINIIIDKNPYYTLQIDKIISVFPDAKFVALIRDYRAYSLSFKVSKNLLESTKSVFYYALVWNLHIKYILKAQNKYGAKIKIVKYEDLVLNNNSILDIISFFDLPYTESIFKFHETMKGKTNELNTQEKNHPRMFKRINDLTIPINTNRISAWEKDLATNTIKKNEFVSMNLGKKFGYIPTQNIGFLDKVFFTISLIPDYFKVKMYEILKSPNFGIYYKYKLNKS